MILRKYQPSDCAQLAQLFYDTVHTINAKDYTPAQLDAWAPKQRDMEKWARSFDHSYGVVAAEKGEILGFGDITPAGYLDRLFVHKNHQREGVATAICDLLERSVHTGQILTHSSVTAKPFFEKRGYRLVREQQIVRQGVSMINFILMKERSPLFSPPNAQRKV